jgi:hypothetical protein
MIFPPVEAQCLWRNTRRSAFRMQLTKSTPLAGRLQGGSAFQQAASVEALANRIRA